MNWIFINYPIGRLLVLGVDSKIIYILHPPPFFFCFWFHLIFKLLWYWLDQTIKVCRVNIQMYMCFASRFKRKRPIGFCPAITTQRRNIQTSFTIWCMTSLSLIFLCYLIQSIISMDTWLVVINSVLYKVMFIIVNILSTDALATRSMTNRDIWRKWFRR